MVRSATTSRSLKLHCIHVMKNLRYIFFIALFFNFYETIAQKQSVATRTYQPGFETGTIQDFLQDINHHSGIIIEYASNCIETNKIIVLKGNVSTLGDVLRQVLKGQKVSVIEKNNKLILVPSLSVLPPNAFTNYYSIYGIIKESASEEPLADATIWEASRQKGVYSNIHGYFTLQLPEGKQTITISYAGYLSRRIDINLDNNTRIDVELVPNTDISEVKVISNNIGTDKSGGYKVKASENPQNMIMGESDVVRSLYLLPGIQNAPQVTNGMLVRGGSPDQNIFLLDGNPIFNPTHLLGTLSIVNKTSLKSIQLYKSNFPARFGGGLSSVVEALTKDGNMKEWKGEVNTGLLAGSFTLEGPVVKDKTSIMVSLRQSWINPFLRLMKSGIGVNFYDIHFKCTQLLGKKDKLMLNGYAGHDKLYLHQDNSNNQQQWGNKAASLGWNHLLGTRAFVNTSFNISNYNNIAGFRYSLYDSIGTNLQIQKVYNTFSSIQQYNVQSQLELYYTNLIKVNIGAKLSFTKMKPFNTNVAADFVDKPDDFVSLPMVSYREMVVFYENEIKTNGRLFLRPGIHVSNFQYNSFHYTSWQPRFYAVYKLNVFNQLDVSYNHMTQYLHLVTNPYLGINSDSWIPSTSLLRPEQSDMINLGYAHQGLKKFLFSAEIYYKQLRKVTNYVEGKNLFLNNADWEQNVQSGKGWGYGMELKAEKKTSKWQTHIGYTMSWNWRQFKDINEGNKFPFKYDRRHQLNLSATYKHNKHFDCSGLWTFATGDVFTLPDRIYPDFDAAQQISDPLVPREYRLVYHSSATNQYRTLPYHRLDISATYHQLPGKKIHSMLTVGIYNIYGSPSQYLYDLEGTLGKRSLFVTTQYKLFSITPYLSYTMSF
ncbi:MAG: TonB-dependent receptor plug [Ferruginibacter sp.]|nr:TonB-dependent receptor plug [Ferruginibacter sp.]